MPMIAMTTNSSTRVNPLRRIRKLFNIIKPFTEIKKQKDIVSKMSTTTSTTNSIGRAVFPESGLILGVTTRHRELWEVKALPVCVSILNEFLASLSIDWRASFGLFVDKSRAVSGI